MKKLGILFLIFSLVKVSFSQIITTTSSVKNGDWMYPTTWACMCVPLPGSTVTINHTVSLDTSINVPSGGITINSNGSLVKDNSFRDLWINGGSLINNGTLNVRYLYTQNGTFSNAGIVTANAILNYINFTNTGKFQNIDSMRISAHVINNGTFQNIDSITIDGTFTNNGVCSFNQFTNEGTYTNNNSLIYTDITNIGTLTNNDSIQCNNSSWNLGTLKISSGGNFNINNSILNGDTISSVAILINNGNIRVHDSWYNADSVKGYGSITVTDTSINWGVMVGSLDFCDLSGTQIDYNLGTIGNNITWCQSLNTNNIINTHQFFYPNPATNYIETILPNNESYQILVKSMDGKIITNQKFSGRFYLDHIVNGIYIVQIVANNNKIVSTEKIIVNK